MELHSIDGVVGVLYGHHLSILCPSSQGKGRGKAVGLYGQGVVSTYLFFPFQVVEEGR